MAEFPPSIPMPISDLAREQIARARVRIGAAGLMIEVIDDARWRVAGVGTEAFYFPLEDRWRQGDQWGRGTLTLISALRSDDA